MLHAVVEINTVIELAAALAYKGQSHPVQKPNAAAQVRGGLSARQVAGWDVGALGGSCRLARFGRDRSLTRGEIEGELLVQQRFLA